MKKEITFVAININGEEYNNVKFKIANMFFRTKRVAKIFLKDNQRFCAWFIVKKLGENTPYKLFNVYYGDKKIAQMKLEIKKV